MSGLAPSSSLKFNASRARGLAAVLRGVWLVAMAGQARAADDDDESFEDRVIRNIMQGLGGTNMENTGIEYRERSPLVVPPKIDLRPPDTAAAEARVPNWPKDPDVQRRKAAIAANKKSKPTPWEAGRTLMPSELNAKTSGNSSVAGSESMSPGTPGAAILSPSQLGFTGFNGMFGGSKTETAPFKGEPTRDSLTMPPSGYQTPSPAYAYGTGPKESLNRVYSPVEGKY